MSMVGYFQREKGGKKKRTGGAGCVRAESAPAPYLKAVAFNSGIILAVGVAFRFKI